MRSYSGFLVFLVLALCPLAPAQTVPDARDLATSLSALNRAVPAFRSVVTTTDMRTGREETTTFILTLSRTAGWRIAGSDGLSTYTVINDLNNDLRLYGTRREAHLLRSDGNADLQRLFRKPLTDLDSLALLDPDTLVYKGEETMDNTTVHRFAGSTTTQFLEIGDPILRRMEIWVGAIDGLSRRTVESADGQIAITLHTDVEVGPPLAPETFSTTPPPGFKLIDVNEQLARLESVPLADTYTTGTVAGDEATTPPSPR